MAGPRSIEIHILGRAYKVACSREEESALIAAADYLDEKMREMKRYRKELAETLEEWDKVGRAPGHICGLIEAAEIENPLSARHKVVAPKRRRK